MTTACVALALVILLCIVAGLARVFGGPSRIDRLLAAQLMGSAGVATLLLLAYGLDRPSLVDVALVIALLAAVTSVTFVQRGLAADAAAGGPRHD